jgi:ABC-type polysaccharide/polyol phosphate transport system ATPase subunit
LDGVSATDTRRPTAPAATADPGLVVSGVCKDFRLPHDQVHTLKERALHPFRSRSFEALRALDDVSFEVTRGEFFGIVGRNGSGKSTLLRCLAGIYRADRGEIAVDGRVSPFIELGVGFNPELTARDNVVLNALMLGLTPREARERFDDIIRFAELEDFLDLRLKNYSSGMQVRLGFSVAIQVESEVLLVDEVLAVGDAAFQQKCYEQFHRLKDEGRTVVFVTHDMAAVEQFCDRALLLERGKVVDVGEPATIARQYNELNFGRRAAVADVPAGVDAGAAEPATGGGAQILRAWFENWQGLRMDSVGQGERCRVAVEFRANERLVDPILAVILRNERHETVTAIATHWRHGSTGTFAPGDEATVVFQFDMHLAPGRYELMATVARRGTGDDVLDTREEATSIVVHGTLHSGGYIDLPHQVEVIRAGGDGQPA